MFKLPDPPYEPGDLEPVISARTMRVHHDKHHAKYIETMNAILAETGEDAANLEALVRRAAREPDAVKLFHNAAQAWNHTFFWTCMSPTKGRPDGELAGAIAGTFGDTGKLKTTFVEAGAAHFGSGWVWLAADKERLKVFTTHDGDNLLTREGVTPLITCDLWEHAYYLDYQHDRGRYLEAWFDALPNWAFAAAQYRAAQEQGETWRHPLPERRATGTRAPAQRSSPDATAN